VVTCDGWGVGDLAGDEAGVKGDAGELKGVGAFCGTVEDDRLVAGPWCDFVVGRGIGVVAVGLYADRRWW